MLTTLLLLQLILPASGFFAHDFRAIRISHLRNPLFATRRTDNVEIIENVFNPAACEMLHYLAIEHNERTNDGSSLFTRPPHNKRPLTPIEHAIHSALTEMGDNTKRVEFWSREEYMNIDTHADIDETMLEDEGRVRCPETSHILYLQVKEGLRGPTCVFPNEKSGWGLNEGDGKDLVIVPAVEGRILRFPGSAMHSVPKPPHRWLLSREEEKQLRDEEKCCEEDDDDDEFYDDDEFEDEEIERSVLLFNTWSDDEPPPIGVTGDIATGALPEGIELSKEDSAAYLKSQDEQIFAEWKEDYGINFERVGSNPASEWSVIEIVHKQCDQTEPLHVSLMGMEKRRLFPKKSAQLLGPIEEIKLALTEKHQATSVYLVDDPIKTNDQTR